MKNFVEYCRNNSLILNEKKTKVMVFHKGRGEKRQKIQKQKKAKCQNFHGGFRCNFEVF